MSIVSSASFPLPTLQWFCAPSLSVNRRKVRLRIQILLKVNAEGAANNVQTIELICLNTAALQSAVYLNLRRRQAQRRGLIALHHVQFHQAVSVLIPDKPFTVIDFIEPEVIFVHHSISSKRAAQIISCAALLFPHRFHYVKTHSSSLELRHTATNYYNEVLSRLECNAVLLGLASKYQKKLYEYKAFRIASRYIFCSGRSTAENASCTL